MIRPNPISGKEKSNIQAIKNLAKINTKRQLKSNKIVAMPIFESEEMMREWLNSLETPVEKWLDLYKIAIFAEKNWGKIKSVELENYISIINEFLKTKHNSCMSCGHFMKKIHSDFQIALWKYCQKHIPMFMQPLPKFECARLNGDYWKNHIQILSFELLQNEITRLVNDSVRLRKSNYAESMALNNDAISLRKYKIQKMDYFSDENFQRILEISKEKDTMEALKAAEEQERLEQIEIEISKENGTFIEKIVETPVIRELPKSITKKGSLDLEKLLELRAEGKNLSECAKILDVSVAAVSLKLKKWKLENQPQTPLTKLAKASGVKMKSTREKTPKAKQ